MTWTRGKKLKEYGDATFEYDAQGRRIKKNDISYYYDSRNRLIKSSDGMEYYYDEKGIIGFDCGGVKYIYRKDVQGNIIGIVDKSGKSVVEYRYDAWGNCTILKDSVLGKQNPFRYRSYYFDEETGLYHLKTRYYDPETGRFLNMDSINYADPETVNGLNLYAYCNNNPVMNIDPSGHLFFTFLLIGLVAGAVIGGTVNGVKAYEDGARGWELASAIATGAVVGGGIGVAAGAFAGVGAALISAGASMIGSGLGAAALVGGGVAGLGSAAIGIGAVVTGGALVSTGILGGLYLMAEWVPDTWPGDDPTIPPGDNFVWRGPGEVGSEFGEWYNPITHDQLHPNLQHPLPKGPHWGWRNKIMKIFKDIFKLV